MAITYSPQFQQMMARAQEKPPVDYSTYGSAVAGLRGNQREAQGYINDNLSMAGSEAAGLAAKAGGLESARGIDPFSFYRGDAADTLASSYKPNQDPSNIYRSRLKEMMMGKFDSSDPSYQWRFEQGQQALERSLGARGLLNSGNAGIELQQYGQNAASTEYQAQFNRLLQSLAGVEDQYNSQQSRLMKLAGIDNVGEMNQRYAMDAGIADNANYQSGIASRMNQNTGINQAFGGGGGSNWSGADAGANQMELDYQAYQNSLDASRQSPSYYR